MHRTKSVVAKILVAAAIVLVLVPAAGAAPGGNGKGKGNVAVEDGTCSSPTLAGTPGLVGEDYTVTGCGFAPGEPVGFTIGEANGCCRGVMLWADANGEISYTEDVWGSGEYKFNASTQHGNGNWRIVAEWSFTVS